MEKLPRVGDRVIIEVGGFEKEGEVTHVSATPPAVEVEFWRTGESEPTRISYPPKWVRPAEPANR